ncbi:MAG: 6,7-dimethyl-8-ribityllumazine synthase [Verrucomicrobiota bacterium]
MSDAAPVRRPSAVAAQDHFVIVASEFNAEFVDGLIAHALTHLRNAGGDAEVVRVPGAFEIPVVVRELVRAGSASAILAMGVILKGRTDHAEHLARCVTDALQRIALESAVPVIHCVLSLADEEQARERCLGEKINRGTEAAEAALGVTRVLRDLRQRG